MEHDRRGAVGAAQCEDVADEQRMVAARMARDHLRGNRRVSIGQQGRVADIFVVHIHALDGAPGKMADQRLLAARENVHAEMPGLEQEGMHARLKADRDHAQRRIERSRHEGVRGHAAHLATQLRRDDGDAGDERGHDMAKQLVGHHAVLRVSAREEGAEPVISCSS